LARTKGSSVHSSGFLTENIGKRIKQQTTIMEGSRCVAISHRLFCYVSTVKRECYAGIDTNIVWAETERSSAVLDERLKSFYKGKSNMSRLLSIATRRSLVQGEWRVLPQSSDVYRSKAKEFERIYAPLLLHWCDPIVNDATTNETAKPASFCKDCGKNHPEITASSDHVRLVESVIKDVLTRLSSPEFRYNPSQGFRNYLNRALRTKALRYWIENSPERFKSWMITRKLSYGELVNNVAKLIQSQVPWQDIYVTLSNDLREWLIISGCLNGTSVDLILANLMDKLKNDAVTIQESLPASDMENHKRRIRNLVKEAVEQLSSESHAGANFIDDVSLEEVTDGFVVNDGSFDRLSLLTLGCVTSAIPANHQWCWLGEVLGLTGIQVAELMQMPRASEIEQKRSVNTIHQLHSRNAASFEAYTLLLKPKAEQWTRMLRDLSEVADDVGSKVRCNDALNDFTLEIGKPCFALDTRDRATWLAIGLSFPSESESQNIMVAKQLGCCSYAVARWLGWSLETESEKCEAVARIDQIYTECQSRILTQCDRVWRALTFADEQLAKRSEKVKRAQ
jgi:hypothetical protein